MTAMRAIMLFVGVALLGAALPGCENRAAPAVHRVELREVGDLVELVPKQGNPPYCLVYSIAERGPIRQLTMNEENESFDCPPGVAIGTTGFRIPKKEGRARIFVIFSDQKLSAATVAEQISDLGKPSFSALDLRVPGKAVSDVIEYAP
jgi:hypothetical protein